MGNKIEEKKKREKKYKEAILLSFDCRTHYVDFVFTFGHMMTYVVGLDK